VSYQVRTVARAADAPAALWDSGFAPPLEGRWWYEAVEQSGLDAQFTFLYAVIDDQNGRPVGLAPLFVTDMPMELVVPEEIMPVFKTAGRVFPQLLVQRTLFVGSPCSDEGTVAIVAGEDRSAILIALARALDQIARDRRAPMIVWKDFPDSYETDMKIMGSKAGFFPTVSYPGAEVHFVSLDKADYFARMKPSHRQQLRRKLRRSTEQADLDVSVVQAPDEAILDEAFGLFMQTYERAATRFERLDIKFFKVASKLPNAHFILLRSKDDGKLAAFMLCFASPEGIINKFIGIDYARPKDWMLYFRLWDALVDWTLSLCVKRLQSGQTGYRVKIELGNSLVPLTNYARHRWPLVHAIYKIASKTISWATLDPDLAHHLAAHGDNPEATPSAWREGSKE
jgi:predicted N-acyltransferase